MKEQRLTKLLKAGYPSFKENSGVPVWLLPERSFETVADRLGDGNILEMVELLGCADNINELVELDLEKVTEANVWEDAVESWPLLSFVASVASTLLQASHRIMSQKQRRQLNADPSDTCRCLLAISYAPFIAQGKEILGEMASILGGGATGASELIMRFVDAVLDGDMATVARVSDCINRHPCWRDWTDKMVETALDFTVDYKLIAVTPSLSEELTYTLAMMVKETYGA